MAAKIKALEQRKRELIFQSQLYRQSMDEELRNVKTATAWVPTTIKVARSVYPIVLLATPLLGLLFGKKRDRSSKPAASPAGILSSALAGYKLFRKVKPVWDGLRSWRS